MSDEKGLANGRTLINMVLRYTMKELKRTAGIGDPNKGRNRDAQPETITVCDTEEEALEARRQYIEKLEREDEERRKQGIS